MIVHVDMDAFFASVEQLDNPSLRGKPVIIGGGQRGVVSTASYEARKYGIHSAMPAALARKLCPHGIFLHGRYDRYRELSHIIRNTLREFSPVVEAASIDEAYLDFGLRSYGEAHEMGLALKARVRQATGGLTCSVGMAQVKFLAKICSDINKPDGIFILHPKQAQAFLDSLPVERLPGVGRHMAASLHALGISNVGQIKELSLDFLSLRFGKWGEALYGRARGLDNRRVHENEPRKSEGAERTFAADVRGRAPLRDALAAHAMRISESMRRHGHAGRTISLKIKFADFSIITRSCTIAENTDSSDIIYAAACSLLDNEPLPQPVRLIGISVSGFEQRPMQLFLPGVDWNITPGKRKCKAVDFD